MDKIKISIVTVVYNAVKTIERTIKSVINQDYKELEYIIIDGGSVDGTLEIIKKYENYIAYWISEPDHGIYSAMNKGIAVATGDVVAFLNSDDWYEEGVFKYVAECFKEDNEVLIGRVNFYNNDRIIRKSSTLCNPDDLRKRMIYCHQGVFVRKELFVKCGMFNEKYKIAADYDWLLRVYNEGIAFKNTDKILANFRTGGISSSKEANTESWLISLNALQKLKKQNRIDIKEYERLKQEIMSLRQKINSIYCFRKALSEGLIEKFDIKEEIKLIFNFEQKYSIFGCGKIGEECYELLRQIDIEPIYFWDNAKAKWKTYFKGKIVRNPKDIKEKETIVIIASTYYEGEIKAQLEDMGLKECIEFICYSQIRCKVGHIVEKNI